MGGTAGNQSVHVRMSLCTHTPYPWHTQHFSRHLGLARGGEAWGRRETVPQGVISFSTGEAMPSSWSPTSTISVPHSPRPLLVSQPLVLHRALCGPAVSALHTSALSLIITSPDSKQEWGRGGHDCCKPQSGSQHSSAFNPLKSRATTGRSKTQPVCVTKFVFHGHDNLHLVQTV